MLGADLPLATADAGLHALTALFIRDQGADTGVAAGTTATATTAATAAVTATTATNAADADPAGKRPAAAAGGWAPSAAGFTRILRSSGATSTSLALDTLDPELVSACLAVFDKVLIWQHACL